MQSTSPSSSAAEIRCSRVEDWATAAGLVLGNWLAATGLMLLTLLFPYSPPEVAQYDLVLPGLTRFCVFTAAPALTGGVIALTLAFFLGTRSNNRQRRRRHSWMTTMVISLIPSTAAVSYHVASWWWLTALLQGQG